MKEEKPRTLEELKAEQSKLETLIKVAKEARIAALRKELDDLLKEDAPASEFAEMPRKRILAPNKPVFKRLYTLKEAALSLGMSTQSVRRLVKRSLLIPNRALRTIMFSAEELDRFANRS